MKLRVAVLLLLYKCLVFAPNVIFATEPAASGLTCPLKCTDVLKELQDLEIRLANSENQTEEIKKEKQDLEIRLAKSEAQIEEIKKEKQAQIEEIKQDLEIRLAKSENQTEEIKKEKQAQIEEIKKEKQDLEIRFAKSEAQIEEIKKEKQDFVSWTRKGFLQYSRQLTLDLNTVSKYIRLSENNTVITGTYPELQSYPDHPDRFDLPQVLCRESVSDRRSYWEIEWSEGVSISVSYKSISRKGRGDECVFGTNDQSWSLMCYSSSYSFRHKIDTKLPVKPIISRTVNEEDHYRVGVYVDHSAGTLSFYSVSGDTMSLIHTVQTTFIEPLYPGFRLYYGSSVKL